MTKQALILISLFSLVIAGILLTAFFGMVTIKTNQDIEDIKSFEFAEPKDWFLDSTLTERRHIYYETQSKMKWRKK